MPEPRLARIRIYPIKSLDPVEVDSIGIYPHGKLEHDRSFAIFEGDGDIFKAKKFSEVHRLHAEVDPESLRAAFRIQGQEGDHFFHLEHERPLIGEWLSRHFERPVKLQRDEFLGFADDWTANGPTLISAATIEIVASWFDDLSPGEVRGRLRTNLEIDGVPPFWEDRLYGSSEGDLVPFRIGDVELEGKNACQRCPVPARDVETGEPTPKFARIFSTKRMETLPEWAHRERFDHFYRVAINTVAGEIGPGARLRVGDEVKIGTGK